MPIIFCKSCNAPISFQSSRLGDKIPMKYRNKLKPVSSDGLDKRLCAECEQKKET